MRTITVSALVGVLLLALPVVGFAQGTPDPPTISVTGVGEVKVKPDIARLEIGVETRDKDAAKAVQRNATQADAVIRAIRALGVRDADIQTSGIGLNSEYTEETAPKFKGYKVNNAVMVTLRKIEDVGKTLDAAVQAGANVASNVTFDINDADKEKAEDEALAKAVADAKHQAVLLAKASGLKEIELYHLSKDGVFGMSGAANLQNSFSFYDRIVSGSPTPVTPGRLSVTASVTAIYRFSGPVVVAIP